ncbi:MAG: hypothetical protein ACI4T5_06595, partial [Prevotella sp.]
SNADGGNTNGGNANGENGNGSNADGGNTNGGNANGENGNGGEQESALSRIPALLDGNGKAVVNKKGKKVLAWEQAPLEDTVAALLEINGGVLVEVRDTAQAMKKKADEALNKTKQRKATGDDPIEIAESKMENRKAVEAAQSKVDYWKSVVQNVQNQMLSAERDARAREEAQMTPEQIAEREKQIAEQEKLNAAQAEQRRAEAQKQIEADAEESRRLREQRARYAPMEKAKKELSDDADAMAILSDTEPRDIEEYVAQSIPMYKFLWNDVEEGGSKMTGLQTELGYTSKDMQKMMNIIGTREKGGQPFNWICNRMYEDMPEGMKSQYDDTDVKNTVLDLLRSSESTKDLWHYVQDKRISEARGLVKQKEEQLWQQELDSYVIDMGMSADEAESYAEMVRQPIESVPDGALAAINDMIINREEEMQEYLDFIDQNIEEYEQSRRSEEMGGKPEQGRVLSAGEEGQAGMRGTAAVSEENNDGTGAEGSEAVQGKPVVAGGVVDEGAQIDADSLIDAARNGDERAISTLELYGINWKTKTVYRHVSQSEIEALLNGETINGKHNNGRVDVTSSKEPTTGADSQYRITFGEDFDFGKEKNVRMKNDELGDGWTERGYSLDDISTIEERNEDGTYTTIFEKKKSPTPAISSMDVDSNLNGKSDDTATQQDDGASDGKGTTKNRDLQEKSGKSEENEINPIGEGDFGPIYDQFRGNAKGAVTQLSKMKNGEATAALHHKDIGDIDLVWGKEGTGHSDGFGLAKLIKYHPEVVDNLQEIIDEMSVVSRSENRVNLESKKYKAGVRLTWNEKKKTWLLTLFEKKNSASDNTTDTDETVNNGKLNDTATQQDTAFGGKGTTKNRDLQEKSGKSEEKGEKKDGYGADNAIVSRDRYEELKKRMRIKLGGQLNAGFDPELLVIGVEMAAYHIEAGARKFADYARNMVADLGDGIRPYLKAFYNGAREMPELSAAGYDKDMTPYDEVRNFDVNTFDKNVRKTFGERLSEAKAETDTNPTEAQKIAGNYKKGHIRIDGYEISIENPKDSVRSGVDPNGKPWSIKMNDTYGYIGKKYGADGDHLDVYINDAADLDNFNGSIYVIDLYNDAKGEDFDEHKIMWGYESYRHARESFLKNYDEQWAKEHMIVVTGIGSKDGFKRWLESSETKRKPFSEIINKRVKKLAPDSASTGTEETGGNARISRNARNDRNDRNEQNARNDGGQAAKLPGTVADGEDLVGKIFTWKKHPGNNYYVSQIIPSGIDKGLVSLLTIKDGKIIVRGKHPVPLIRRQIRFGKLVEADKALNAENAAMIERVRED